MNEQDCGICGFQGQVTPEKAECRLDGKMYKRPHSCEDFKEHVQGKTNEERLIEVIEKKREKEAQKNREHATELTWMKIKHNKKLWRANWWWQLILVIVGAVLGILGTLIFKL